MAYKPQVLEVADGGTGSITLTDHGVLIGSGTSPVTALAAGTANQVLQSGGAGADPAYSSATYPPTTTANQILYSSAANTVAGLTSANNGILITSGAGVPSISSTLPAAVQANITSTGTISSGTWNGSTINVANGGTGVTSNTAYAVLCGGTTSTGAIQSIASVGTSGQVLTSNGAGAKPTFQTASSPASTCAFKVGVATNIANVTGNDTLYPILFDTSLFDLGSNITLNSGGKTIFTAPSAGYYVMNFSLNIYNLGSSSGFSVFNMYITPNGGAEYIAQIGNPYVQRSNDGYMAYNLNTVLSLTSSQTVSVSFKVFGGTKTVGVIGNASSQYHTYWSGFKL